jgi:hypothetical protein
VRERYRALVAVVPPALADLQRMLSEYADLMPVYRLEDAVRLVESDAQFDAILCGVHFDESRMFDLLTCVRDRRPSTPFVCLRILDFALPKISIDAIRIATSSLGATAFIPWHYSMALTGWTRISAGAVLSHLKGREASAAGS